MNENPESSNRVPVADLAVDVCSARGATATPMTDREDKVIRHYCDISWQERYDLMREHAEEMERQFPMIANESDEDAFDEWNRGVTEYNPALVDAYAFGLTRARRELAALNAQFAAVQELARKIEPFAAAVACDQREMRVYDACRAMRALIYDKVPF